MLLHIVSFKCSIAISINQTCGNKHTTNEPYFKKKDNLMHILISTVLYAFNIWLYSLCSWFNINFCTVPKFSQTSNQSGAKVINRMFLKHCRKWQKWWQRLSHRTTKSKTYTITSPSHILDINIVDILIWVTCGLVFSDLFK